MKKMRYVMVLVVVLIFACEKKPESAAVKDLDLIAVQEQYPPKALPVLEIPFVNILDNYFATGDTIEFARCIGKIVTSEEMGKVTVKKYNFGGIRLEHRHGYDKYGFMSLNFRTPINDISSGKSVLYTTAIIRRVDGQVNDFMILDITALEGQKGYYIHNGKLYERDSQSLPHYISVVPNSLGVIEYIFPEDPRLIYGNILPYDTPIVPNWIVTVNEGGKISITKPVDDSKFEYFSIYD